MIFEITNKQINTRVGCYFVDCAYHNFTAHIEIDLQKICKTNCIIKNSKIKELEMIRYPGEIPTISVDVVSSSSEEISEVAKELQDAATIIKHIDELDQIIKDIEDNDILKLTKH